VGGQAFHELLLLKRGGRMIYFGSIGQESADLIAYFEAVPGTAPCKIGFNPATWMLEQVRGRCPAAMAGRAAITCAAS
jgi:hypothetical protein